MLTARDQVEDRVAGPRRRRRRLRGQAVRARGAARARARAAAAQRRATPTETLRFADLELDPGAHEVRRDGEPIELTRTEFSLLELFMRNPRQVLTRSVIFERVWGYDFGYALELARRLRRLPAPQDRGGRPAAADPDDPRRRLRPARADELPRAARRSRPRPRSPSRSSLALGVAYVVVRDQLRGAGRRRACAARRERSRSAGCGSGAAILAHPAAALGGAAATSRSSRRDGRDAAAAERRRSRCRSRGRDGQVAAGDGRRRSSPTTRVGGDRTSACYTVPATPTGSRSRSRGRSARSTTRSRGSALILFVDRGRRHRASRRCSRSLVARHVLRPVRRLTEATEYVAETRDLTQPHRGPAATSSPGSRRASTRCSRALEESLRAQRQLVADASHELRTPLTSLRTNIEVLARADALPEARARASCSRDVVEQLTEMSTLVSELVQLARGDVPGGEPETLRLDELVAESVERARRNAPRRRLRDRGSTSRRSRACPSALERAVGNLLDNAAKWSPPGGTVEVARRRPRGRVRDHGPGHRRGGPAVRLRPLLPRAVGARACPAPGSASRSSARSPRPTAAR